MSNLDKLANILQILHIAIIFIDIDKNIDLRSQTLENLGFSLYDSFHIACAEVAKADILLTTDDRLLKKAIYYQDRLMVKVSNPVTWMTNIFQLEGVTSNDTD